ncbi:MAG: thiol protease/hemagglutinin PrtT [Bacteroidales bacterium]|nr:thiol protease/hemagglutinin PrtT [Bacteroidales bacterium]
MRKLVITTVALVATALFQLSINQTHATNIGENDARQVGTRFMQRILSVNELSTADLELVYTFTNSLNGPSDLVSTYIYNVYGRAWVAVAGNDHVHPIVAFSEEGPFNPGAMAPALMWNLEVSAENIAAVQNYEKDYTPDENTVKMWAELLNGSTVTSTKRGASTKAPMILLRGICWEQGDPVRPTFNKFCPVVRTAKYTTHRTTVTDTVEVYDTIDIDTIGFTLDTVDLGDTTRIDTLYNLTYTIDTTVTYPHNIITITDTTYIDSTCYVGCVATAMSQIMYYWQYPQNPQGFVSTNNPGDPTHPDVVRLDTVFYDYSLMSGTIDGSTSTEQINEMARLCHHVGVSVGMDYGTDGSGAYSFNVPNTMMNNFKYKRGVTQLQREYTSVDNYVNITKGDIMGRKPVYMSGSSSTGIGRDAAGHAWVCDGIRDDNGMEDFFHMNWGWGCGSSLSWNNLRTNAMSIKQYNFNRNQSIIYSIIPPDDSVLSISTVAADVLPAPAFPNPATRTINIPYTVKQNATLSVYTTDGRLVEECTIKPDNHVATISLNTYPKGVYIYRIEGCAGRFVVQ